MGRALVIHGLVAAILLTGCTPFDGADAGTLDGSSCGRPCDDEVFCNGEERCAPRDPAADEDGCVAAPSGPCDAPERCDESAGTCFESSCDADEDGVESVACGGMDCDDEDPRRFGGNTEVCDDEDLDEDCNPFTFAEPGGVGDLDRDESALPTCCNVGEDGTRRCGMECDDARPDISGRAEEVCDGIDDDCDGEIDENVQLDFGLDADQDGSGVDGDLVSGCYPPPGRALVSARLGLVDCDDTDPQINPDHQELCEGSDSDCDGAIDEGCGCDPGTARMCVGCFASVRHCRTDGTLGPCEDARNEECNGADDDCDVRIDEGFPKRLCFRDEDGDGFARADSYLAPGRQVIQICATLDCPSGFGQHYTDVVPMGADIDCDDGSSTVHPGVEELCNAVDDDCDSSIDEGC